MNKKTVFVGLSGGVDSSVSAALLKKRGFNVVGVFLKVWQPDFLKGTGICTQTQDRRDAMRVAAQLDIPFLEIDCVREYKKLVVDVMIREYKKGLIPNPDVWCNREVKFGVFLKEALKRGAHYIATGHYAQITEEDGKYSLVRGADTNKDQTYFLWTLTQNELAHTLFPVGEMQKKEVRKLAKKFGLHNAGRKDSQGICFVGKVDMKKFLTQFIKTKKGKVLDTNGKVIGEHDGAIFYAMGERHGFRVKTKSKGSEPLYVVSKDLNKNSITVSTRLTSNSDNAPRIILRDENWIYQKPKSKKRYAVLVRYRGKEIPGIVVAGKGHAVVTLLGNDYISPGQSVVVYDGKTCLGGGIVTI